jgi:hypothetical protein
MPNWVLGGDFNMILTLEEKTSGTKRLEKDNGKFRTLIDQLNLVDIEARNGIFTWSNRINIVHRDIIPETLNRENLSYIHYIKFHHSLYNIYTVFRYSVDTKTLTPKTEISFSKPIKIAKTAQKKNSGRCPERYA